MKFNKNEFGWKEKVSINTNLNNDILNIKFLPDMNTNSNMYIVNIIDLEEKTTYRVNGFSYRAANFSKLVEALDLQ